MANRDGKAAGGPGDGRSGRLGGVRLSHLPISLSFQTPALLLLLVALAAFLALPCPASIAYLTWVPTLPPSLSYPPDPPVLK